MLTVKFIAVGSTNPAKVAAVRAIAYSLWPDAGLQIVDVPSGVRAQPLSDQEMVEGATFRARRARKVLDADLGVGLEGGVQPSFWGYLLSGWAAVCDRSGRFGLGSAGRVVLPVPLAEALDQGQELGPAMDRLSGYHDTRRGPGAVGVLTGGLVGRDEAFRVAITYALAPFLHPDWYSENSWGKLCESID